MRLNTAPFTQDHIDDAAALLAARYRADRTRTPVLPSLHDEPEAVREALRKSLVEPGARGVVVFRDGRMAGYILGGMVLQAPRMRSAWVEYTGHAAEVTDQREIIRTLYAAFAPPWLESGCFAHYLLAPAGDREALDAWRSLGFGIEQAHALCDLRPLEGTPATPPGFEVRRATRDDIDAVVALVRQLRTHQAASPVYGVALPEHIAAPADAIELLDDPAMMLWLSCQDGTPVSVVLMGATTPDATTPERCIELKIGVTDRNVRGTGAGRHIVAHALRHARAAGMEWCKADWRATNVEAARFWPRQGFVPIVYRLFRHVDERIAWATG